MPAIRIVHTVTASDMTSLRQGREKASGADLVELRLDGVADLDVAGALRDRTQPVIVTCRPVWEGGAFDGAEDTRRRILQEAVDLGAEFVDVERRAEWRPDRTGSRTQLVLSDHEFTGVPADLGFRVAAMRAERPEIVKIAAMPQSAADCLTLRDAAGGAEDTVVIGMGNLGRITRVLPSRFGSCWTYGGAGAAPGQRPAEELERRYRVRAVTQETEVYAVTGRPLEHSASPAMHNAAFQHLGRDAVYVPLEAVSGDDARVVAEALGMRGLSVTAPFKRDWALAADGCDDAASRALGTINTLKWSAGRWLGRNVDVDGFLDPIDARGIALRGAKILVLGAGGAARAVTYALRSRGAHVTLSARRPGEAQGVAAALGAGAITWPPGGIWDMLVNATPVGTFPGEGETPVAFDGLSAAVVYDLVYNPDDTALLRAARASGADCIGGLEMLVGQAVRQCEWWMGSRPPADAMAAAARAWIAGTGE